MRKISYVVVLCMIITILGAVTVIAYNHNCVNISIDGDYVRFNDDLGYPFFDSNSRTQVPFRVTLEKFGAVVSWDKDNNRAVAEKNGIKIEVPIGEKYILRNGDKIENDTQALVKNGRTYLPIRVVMEAFGCEVGWIQDTNTVLISSPSNSFKSSIKELTENSVTVTFEKHISNEELHKDTFASLTNKESNLQVKLWEVIDNKIVFSDLKPNTEYEYKVYDSYGKVYETIPFKTFKGTEDVELSYFIDVRDEKSQLLKVTIIGIYNGINDFYFKRRGFHVQKNVTKIIEDSLTVDLDGAYKYESNNPELNMKFNSNKGTFNVKYLSDKSYAVDTHNHGCEGILTEKYLLISGEQFLLSPEVDTSEVAISMIIPQSWGSEVGYTRSSLDNMYVADKSAHINGTNFYAYDKESFNVNIKNLYGTEVVTIIEKGIEEDYSKGAFEFFKALCEVWGDTADDDRYSLMVINDDRLIYAGEYDRGQGYSKRFGMSMFIHQIYHRWNGWDIQMEWDRDSINVHHGLWTEGFNDYYVYKLLEDYRGEGKEHMMSWYDNYKNDIATNKDDPILKDEKKSPSSVYYKGAVIAYALDKEIRLRTDNKFSLDDILKYLWSDWKMNGDTANYDKMINYINTIVPGGIDDWWQEYVVSNKEIVLKEFEQQ